MPRDRPVRSDADSAGGPDAVRQPFRSRALSVLIYLVAFALLMGLGLGLANAMSDSAGGSNYAQGKLAMIVAAALVFPLFYLAAKLGSPSVERVLARDQRPPVLYLRSFAVDRDQVLRQWLNHLAPAHVGQVAFSQEQRLTKELSAIGPVIAIGRPGERLGTLGAARLYVGDDAWQAVVSNLAEQAALVVLRIGTTEGLIWEVERAAGHPPDKILLYEPHYDWRRREATYQAFKRLADPKLPHPLPERLDAARYIWFDEQWRPHLLTELKPVLDARVPHRETAPPVSWPRRIGRAILYILAFIGFLTIVTILFSPPRPDETDGSPPRTPDPSAPARPADR